MRTTARTLVRISLATILTVSGGAFSAPPGGVAARFVVTWGEKGDRPGEFYSPIGIALNRRDEVLVTDLNNARLQRFTANGRHLGGFDLPRDTPERKSSLAGGIALDGAGLLYLTFMMQHCVRVYTEDGRLVREWGRRGEGDGEFNQPGGILLGRDGLLYVADQCNHRIQAFTLEGGFRGKWGGHGLSPGRFGGNDRRGSRFAGPHFLTQDSRGRILTTEGTTGRVQLLTPLGAPLGEWGSKGDEPGGFGSYKTNYGPTFGPIAIAVDRHDRVFVSSLNDRVQMFTPEGRFMGSMGAAGPLPGQFARPHGLAFDSRGRLYVADAGNERIQVFEVPLSRG